MTVQDNWKEPVNEEAFKSLQKLCQFYELEEVDKLRLELKIFYSSFPCLPQNTAATMLNLMKENNVQERVKLRLEAEIAEVVAEEKILQQFDEDDREITPVTRIREHIDPDIGRSEQPMSLGAVAPAVNSGRNNQRDLSYEEVMQALISCSLKSLMPKQDIAKFEGDYTKYFRFIHSFDDVFSSQLTNDKERLRYLDLYTTGRPNEIVAACLHLDASEGYRQARKLLEERYSNHKQIATTYVDKVIKWKDMGENNAEDFDEYAVMLKTCRNAISCVPYGVAALQNPKTMRLILSKFPSSVQDRWCRVADKIISEKMI
ncbi:uncharacterized protein LOC135221251 [Macrobrachium nipponense]|uniref:uncharacterized protein LOC135221251 n=1 Tax=Macrobrachium nipponense TaxID=159736 RepID=UPI0030C83067